MRKKLLVLAATLATIAVVPLGAHARGPTHWIVRDGFYAGMDAGSGELAFFHVRHHRVYHLRFSLNLTCHDDTTGQDNSYNFSAGDEMPQGRLIPADGVLTINWTETDSARDGHINAELRFHRRPVASFYVTSASSVESCNGLSAVYVHRSRARVPVPSQP